MPFCARSSAHNFNSLTSSKKCFKTHFKTKTSRPQNLIQFCKFTKTKFDKQNTFIIYFEEIHASSLGPRDLLTGDLTLTHPRCDVTPALPCGATGLSWSPEHVPGNLLSRQHDYLSRAWEYLSKVSNVILDFFLLLLVQSLLIFFTSLLVSVLCFFFDGSLAEVIALSRS